jgi:uracil-DNA glycosylase family 4
MTIGKNVYHEAQAAELLSAIRDSLKYLADSGCRGFDCDPASVNTVGRWGNAAGKRPFQDGMADIRADLSECRRCPLWETRTHVVLGEGDVSARLVFIGEGPGYEEDKQGRPFVGAAGRLLTKIIQAMNLQRENVYICNIVKCRPPGNRNPKPAEIEACKPFLERQLKVIRPEIICALGTFAAQTLLKTETPISRLRGNFFDWMGIRVLPTYHPAYLLRNPEKKRDVWEDMKKLMRALNLNPESAA